VEDAVARHGLATVVYGGSRSRLYGTGWISLASSAYHLIERGDATPVPWLGRFLAAVGTAALNWSSDPAQARPLFGIRRDPAPVRLAYRRRHVESINTLGANACFGLFVLEAASAEAGGRANVSEFEPILAARGNLFAVDPGQVTTQLAFTTEQTDFVRRWVRGELAELAKLHKPVA